MTFDDGILKIYTVTNRAEPGERPVKKLELKDQYYYGFYELGITRFYEAKRADQLIESVVNVPGWNDIRVTDLCELDDSSLFKVQMVQKTLDEDGLQIMRLSLERVTEGYEMPGESKNGSSDSIRKGRAL